MKKVLLFVLAIVCLWACEKTPEEIPVSSVTLSQPTAEMLIGETLQLQVSISPSNATDKTVIWGSSKQSVATISNTGLVSAIAEGSSTITATAGGKSATCSIVVSKRVIEVTSIELNKNVLSLVEGDSETLIATVKPDDATDKTVSWSSSDDGIVSVDQAGKVTAIKGGEATITASAGDKSAKCVVTVTVPVESVSLDRTNITLEEEQSTTLVATVKPDDATDKSLLWSSSSDSIAKVDQDGKVTAVKEGSATITAKAGDKEATCKVTVQKKVIAVESVTLDRTSATLEEGQSITLVATVKPDNASDKTVTWSSSDDVIASVDQNGKVTAIKVGSVTITAKAGEKQADCKITVQEKPKVSSITFNTNSFNGYIGQDYQVSVSFTPSNAYYVFEWSVSDTRVANIQGNGTSAKIHTLDYGVSEIIVKDMISGKTASITVSTTVTDFVWKENTGETYSGYPLITINEGAEHQLQYSCSPSSATHIFSDLNQFVFYEPYVVNTPSCITISENGLVRGVKEGIVGIKATGRVIKGSSGPDRVYINVKPAAVPVQSISLNKTTLTLKEGESETLVATVYPSNASNKTAVWSSSQTGIAEVDQNGKVTGISAGSATITAMAGNKSATCMVTVTQASSGAEGFKRVEYIELKNTYFRSGVSHGINPKVYVDFELVSLNLGANNMLFGVLTPDCWDNGSVGFNVNEYRHQFTYYMGGVVNDYAGEYVLGDRYNVTLENTACTIRNVTESTSKTIPISSNMEATTMEYSVGAHSSTRGSYDISPTEDFKLFEIIFYENNVETAHFIPYKDVATGYGVLYDTVTKKYIMAAEPSSIIPGKEI